MLSFHLKCQLLFNYFIVQTVRKMCQQTMLKNAKDEELLPKRRAGLYDSGCKLQDKMFTKDWVDLRLKKMQTEPILNICIILVRLQKIQAVLSIFLKAIFKIVDLKMQKALFVKRDMFFQVYHTLFCWQKPKFAVKIWLHSLAKRALAAEKSKDKLLLFLALSFKNKRKFICVFVFLRKHLRHSKQTEVCQNAKKHGHSQKQ